MLDKKYWIPLAAVLGTLVLLLAMTLVLFFWKRSKKRIRSRVFSLRAVTPLDDAEFESWRRPSQYTKRPEKYGIKPTLPPAARTANVNTLLEKELNLYEPPCPPSPPVTTTTSSPPSTQIRKPEQVRRKSSACSSIADRPPTPYSPTSMTGESPRRSSPNSESTTWNHKPSMSETSAFDFNFDLENGSPPHHGRPSHQSDRPLYYSYARYGESL